jgi:hypothetical protein
LPRKSKGYRSSTTVRDIDKHIDQQVDALINQATDFENLPTGRDIPLDPQRFYEDFGLFIHERTGQPVPKLAPYQYDVWKYGQRYRYRLTVKSQKVGMTTSSLLEDFQKAITTCKGHEILIIAQSYTMAKEHLRTLQGLILGSEKYKGYLMQDPVKAGIRTDSTKADMLYIKNPDNPINPTRIIARGSNEGGVWSWKHVKHIHMSDVTATGSIDDTGLFGAAFSRLANTMGSMHIESPPRGQRGKVWDIYNMSKQKDKSQMEESQFKITEIPAREAVAADIITQEFLDAELARLGPLYGQYYECDFINPYTSWYDEDLFEYDDDQLNVTS